MIDQAAPIITVEHLTKRYSKSPTPAVDDISFEVRPGELFAFLGPNGAGKTTTISILTTTLAKTSGTVTKSTPSRFQRGTTLGSWRSRPASRHGPCSNSGAPD